jgi:hypothetical protein
MVGGHRRGYSYLNNFLRFFSNLARNTTSQRNFEFLRNMGEEGNGSS